LLLIRINLLIDSLPDQLLHLAVFASGNSSSLEQFVVLLNKFVSSKDPHIYLHVISPNKELQVRVVEDLLIQESFDRIPILIT